MVKRAVRRSRVGFEIRVHVATAMLGFLQRQAATATQVRRAMVRGSPTIASSGAIVGADMVKAVVEAAVEVEAAVVAVESDGSIVVG